MKARLFQHLVDTAGGELEELNKMLGRLRSSNLQTRLAVGAGVHLANSEFLRRFPGIEPFRRTPQPEQRLFCAQLSDLELASRGEEPGVALGVGLYRMWLTEILAERCQVADLLGQELTELSRRRAE